MKLTTKETGQSGEELAAEFLKKKGYSILEMNYQNAAGRRLGELDIIAQEKQEIVFVEVKTRYSASPDCRPEEMINYQKIHRLTKIAEQYIRSRKLWSHPWRFDAVAITIHPETEVATIRHLDHIFL